MLERRGIPAVVSMQYPISDRAAIEFSRAFYDGLARGLAVGEAVQIARLAISTAPATSAEWATPVLHMRPPDGALFHVDLAGAIFRRQTEAPPPAPPAFFTFHPNSAIFEDHSPRFYVDKNIPRNQTVGDKTGRWPNRTAHRVQHP